MPSVSQENPREVQHHELKPKLQDWQPSSTNPTIKRHEQQILLRQNVRLWYEAHCVVRDDIALECTNTKLESSPLVMRDSDSIVPVAPPDLIRIEFEDNYDGPQELKNEHALVGYLKSTEIFCPRVDTEESFARLREMKAILYCLDSVKGVKMTGTNDYHLYQQHQDNDDWVVNGRPKFSRCLIAAWDDFVGKRKKDGGNTRVMDAVYSPNDWVDISEVMEYKLPSTTVDTRVRTDFQ